MQLAMNIKEVCEATGLGRTKVYEAIGTGALPAKKWGKRTLILKSDLETFIFNLGAYSVREEVRHG